MRNRLPAALLFCFLCVSAGFAQGIRDAGSNAALPVTKISIFSSGLAYHEHTGVLNGPAVINLPFRHEAVNDALKSLVLNDPASAHPTVTYHSEQALFQTLRSLRIDLSDSPDMAVILSRLRGTEVTISEPHVSGRIMGIEFRQRAVSHAGFEAHEPWLSLSTDQGMRMINLNEVSALNFSDPQIRADLQRALDLIALSHNSHSRDLTVSLPGSGSRTVTLSYVIPAPVWKVSYRLNLGQKTAVLQGWAIVDNDSDSDWSNVELTLVAGRPASFIQNLYPPYYLSRPVLPLAIAGAAAAASHDSGYAVPIPRAEVRASAQMKMAMDSVEYSMAEEPLYGEARAGGAAAANFGAAVGAAAGDQFEYTVKTPVSLDRRMSAMLPLVESSVDVRKALVFSGAAGGQGRHPRLGAELVNTSKMKLPAGPITVYDGGYAGDALVEFWNDGEKRIISYGEDLSVTAAVADSSARTTVSVSISGGIMTHNRRQEYTKTYTFMNKAAQEKTLIIEHPKIQDTVLDSPQADEQTPAAYRFTVMLPAEKEYTFLVRESRPIMERIVLAQGRPESFLAYISNREIPPAVQAALRQAVSLWNAVTAAESSVADAEKRRAFLIDEQDRIRKNIEATGNQTEQGQEYLKRLQSLDQTIDAAALEIERLAENVKTARQVYADYLGSLNL